MSSTLFQTPATTSYKVNRHGLQSIAVFLIAVTSWMCLLDASTPCLGQTAKNAPKVRSWKSKDSKFSTQGTLVALDEEKVRIRKADGKTADVPIERLSSVDQTYIKEIVRIDSSATVSLGKVTKLLKDHAIEFTDVDGATLTLRLEGIDFTDASPFIEPHLRSTVLGHFCWVESKETKAEGLSGLLYVHGECVNLDLIAKGLAKYDPLRKLEPRFARAEKYASAKKLGIWGQ